MRLIWVSPDLQCVCVGSTRNCCEPRVETLELAKMYFQKIDHELTLINTDSFEVGERTGEKRS